MSETISELIQNLGDPAVEVRADAAKALGEQGATAKAAVPALLKAVNDRSAAVRDSAIAALSKINLDSTVSALIQNLEDDDDRVRNSAARGISTMVERFDLPPSTKQQVFTALVGAVNNRCWFVRSTVMATLGELAPVEEVLPILIAGLADEEAEVRQDAAIAIQCFGDEAEPAVPYLIDAFWHDIEAYAASALGSIGPGAEAALPHLLAALQREDENLRGRAAEAIGEIGSEAAIPTLIDFLRQEDAGLRQAAAEALQGLGPIAKAAVPDLILALEDKSVEVKATAAKALGEIEPENPAIAELLMPLLQDENASVRASTAHALQLMGKYAEIAVPALIEAFKDEVERVSQSAAKALAEIGTPEAKDAIARYRRQWP
uniref:HEAT repeat domain-containing protein n=1 Tax=Trichocoleus desertorum TaxID=1481672 RepID=UPI0025B5F7E1|nr:HEAT repeat domain-containing protein [Trichocoleus desertorum]